MNEQLLKLSSFSPDVDLAVAGCMASKFRNMGQTCVTSNRILVQEGIYDKFLAKLKDTVEKSLVLGDGMDLAVNQVNHWS